MLSTEELDGRLGEMERSLACFLGQPEDSEEHFALVIEKLRRLRDDIDNDPWNLWHTAVGCYHNTVQSYLRRRQRPNHVTVMFRLLATAARNALCWQKVFTVKRPNRLN